MERPLAPALAARPRIVSLDQFRGYTIAGMFVVNFIGGFTVSPFLLKHHNTFCSYADTIMPHFMFAVGFAFRLSFGRRTLEQGSHAAYGRVVRRLLGLVLIALFIFEMDDRLLPTYWVDLVRRGAWNEVWRPFGKNWTQTLFQIAMATLWVVPVIRASSRVRVAYLIASAFLHIVINHAGYLEWLLAPESGHTGGPLGCVSWSVPALVGTLTCDAIADAVGKPRLGRLLLWAACLMGVGYLLSCGTRFYDVPAEQIASASAADKQAVERNPLDAHPVIPSDLQVEAWYERFSQGNYTSLLAEPPFVGPPDVQHRRHNYWMMSVKSAALSFMLFNAGLSLFIYLLFYAACDIGNFELGMFRTFGRNALAGYLLQWPTDELFTKLVEAKSAEWGPALGYPADAVDRSAPALFVAVGFVLFFALNWLILRIMEKYNVYLRV
ncbi:MAG: heparan-alpha-glucosaminide N-acetyltransferase domain-containing protein [Planctomycetaceae bacterium]